MKILMIINPVSGKANVRAKLIDALAVFSKNGHTVETYVTSKRGDAHVYAKTNGESFDVVIACGGDGTLNEVTSGLVQINKRPLVGYFPTGTMNDFGSNFNLTNDWKETAIRICELNKHPFDVGQFNESRYFNYVAAFGAFTDVPYTTPQEEKNVIGNLAYILEGVNKLAEIKAIPLTVKTADRKESYKAIVGFVFNGSRVSGLELVDKNEVEMGDGQYNVLIVEYPSNFLELIDFQDFLKLINNRQSKFLHWYKVSEIEFEFEEDVKWTLDGESAKSGKQVSIKNLKGALSVLA